MTDVEEARAAGVYRVGDEFAHTDCLVTEAARKGFNTIHTDSGQPAPQPKENDAANRKQATADGRSPEAEGV